METAFPQEKRKYLTAKDFQDQKRTLTFRGWEKVHNVDRPAKGSFKGSTWKETLQYVLPYSYPEYAFDKTTGEKRLDSEGNQWKNRNYDPKYPQGYTINYIFDEGALDSGSMPLWKAFCGVSPTPGDRLVIGKTGIKENTVWQVKKVSDGSVTTMKSNAELPEVDFSAQEMSGDPEINPENGLPF